MLVSSDISGLLLAGLKTQFFSTFTQVPSEYEKIATVIPSDKDTEHYAWLGALPGMSEFLDERQVAEFSEYEYQVKNKTWESTVSVARTALEDDQYGAVAMRVKSLAYEAKQHIDQLVFGLLSNGFTTNCYDGQPFFGTHAIGKNSPYAGTTQSNLCASGSGAGALSYQTLQNALIGTLQAALIAMERTLNDQGRPMGVMPDTLVVSPENRFNAEALLQSVFYPQPVTSASGVVQNIQNNTLKDILRIHVSPYLPSQTAWIVLDTKRPVRAVFLQMRREFEFESLEGTSEEGFMRDRYLYGVRGRYNVGFGDWRCAYGSQGT
jgi:phage major head subunit gpT-like protein